MTVRTIVVLVDDIDGSEIEDGKGETVDFSLDGIRYAIDLREANARKLRDALSVYIQNGRKVGRIAASNSTPGRTEKADLAAAREWLRANGDPVSDRGRIAAPLMEKFRNATK